MEEEGDEYVYIVNWVVYGVISWASLFLVIRKIFWKRSFDFSNRIVSTVHASLAVTLSVLSIQDWRCPLCPLSSPPSPLQAQTLAITIAYLIYDLICCVFDTNIKLDNSIHHIVSIVGLSGGLFYKMCGSEMVAAICITEVSSPFLHMRELLKELGHKDSDLNLAADIMFAAVFTLGRMVGGPYLTFVTLTADIPLILKSMALGIQLVSAFWFYKIARMVKYKLTRRTPKKLSSQNI